MTKSKKERLHYVDVAKGLLILMVILLHVSYTTIHDYSIKNALFEGNLVFVNVVFTPFFMPAFFVITGMCTNFYKPFILFIWSSIKSIIIPVLIVMLPFNFYITNSFDASFILVDACWRWFCFALFILRGFLFYNGKL